MQQNATSKRYATILVPILRFQKVLEIVDHERCDIAVENHRFDWSWRSSQRESPIVAVLERIDARSTFLFFIAEIPRLHKQILDELCRCSETADCDSLGDDRFAKEPILNWLTDRSCEPNPFTTRFTCLKKASTYKWNVRTYL